jgi:hypothetical protein
MLLQLLLSAVAILVAWTVLDTVMHRLLLQPFYAENTSLWRTFDCRCTRIPTIPMVISPCF